MLLISIPTPCHEDWNQMSPREQGAFCGVCAKTVVDFTKLSDEQVKNYFLDNAGKKTCGRFRNDQLVTDAELLPRILSGNIPVWKKFLAAVVILFAGLLTSCNDRVKGKVAPPKEYQTTGITLTEIKIDPDTMALPLPPPDIKTVVCEVTQGETIPIDYQIMGDAIMMVPIPEIEKKDSIVKKDTIKGCDGPAKDSLTYYDPE